MRNTFISNLLNQAEKDQSIFLVVGDLGYGVVETFENRFPERFLNAGIAEQNMIGVSAGLAKSGFKVFVYSIANFPTFRCLEQIRNDVCYGELDVTIVSVGSDPIEVELAVEYAVNNSGPKYLRLGKNGEETINKSKAPSLNFPSRIHDGANYCILVTGGIATEALKAVQRFKKQFLLDVAVFSVPLITSRSLAHINFQELSKIFMF